MTKQLAPIEELAKQCGFEIHPMHDGTNATGIYAPNSGGLFNMTNELEQLRQAIIRDFVSTLEPVHSQFFDVNKWYDYLNEKHKKNTIEAGYLHRDLYDLSEWSNK